MMKFGSESVAQTSRVAALLASTLKGGETVLLHGELGAGKTTFAKALAAALGVKEEVVSPTFTIAKEYRGDLGFFHLDMYRIESEDALQELGIEETCFAEDAVTVIEWNKIKNFPGKVITVRIETGRQSTERQIIIDGAGEPR